MNFDVKDRETRSVFRAYANHGRYFCVFFFNKSNHESVSSPWFRFSFELCRRANVMIYDIST